MSTVNIRALFLAYCRHIKKGYSDDSFPQCDAVYIKELMEKHPDKLPYEKLGRARRERLKLWEEKGMGIVPEKEKPLNAAMWVFNMKARFGWRDKQSSSESEDLDSVDINIV